MKKVVRKIIQIDEDRCDGCGQCLPACPEQAIQLVETPQGMKAKLLKEIYCDGLGACLGFCPQAALTVEERESEPYDEEATVARIQEVAPEMLSTHLEHLKEELAKEPERPPASSEAPAMTGCPSARMRWRDREETQKDSGRAGLTPSELRQWPIQLHLVPAFAPFFNNADVAIVADCVPFAYAEFHRDFLRDKAIAVGCPKLDDTSAYVRKIADIINHATPKSLQVVVMEVPCCSGLVRTVEQAIERSGKKVPYQVVVIGIDGERKQG